MDSSTSRHGSSDPAIDRALWIGALAGPLLFLVAQLALFVLAYGACWPPARWPLHATTLAAVTMTAWAGRRAWAMGHADQHGEHPTTTARARWMAVCALVLSVWSGVTLASFELPVVLLPACQ